MRNEEVLLPSSIFSRSQASILHSSTNNSSLDKVNPKKHLGQHFLADPNIARNIVDALRLPDGVAHVLEIGPGMGVLTANLLQNPAYETSVVEIDRESVAYLERNFPALGGANYFRRLPASGLEPAISG